MSEFKVCRICLRTEAKMYRMRFNYPSKGAKPDSIHEFAKLAQLRFYSKVMGLSLNETENPPPLFCHECASILHEFQKFREKCYLGQNKIKVMLYYFLIEDRRHVEENRARDDINPDSLFLL